MNREGAPVSFAVCCAAKAVLVQAQRGALAEVAAVHARPQRRVEASRYGVARRAAAPVKRALAAKEGEANTDDQRTRMTLHADPAHLHIASPPREMTLQA